MAKKSWRLTFAMQIHNYECFFYYTVWTFFSYVFLLFYKNLYNCGFRYAHDDAQTLIDTSIAISLPLDRSWNVIFAIKTHDNACFIYHIESNYQKLPWLKKIITMFNPRDGSVELHFRPTVITDVNMMDWYVNRFHCPTEVGLECSRWKLIITHVSFIIPRGIVEYVFS